MGGQREERRHEEILGFQCVGKGVELVREGSRELALRAGDVVLDEPAAGLPDRESEHMGEVIRRIPEHTGALAILVDHDMTLVQACCGVTAVLDFGKLIASGPTAEVLRDERVIRAYLGTEEVT